MHLISFRYIIFQTSWETSTYKSQKHQRKPLKIPVKDSVLFLQKCKVFSLYNSGWRKNMEDAVIHEKDFGDGNSLFGVFDGHGGF